MSDYVQQQHNLCNFSNDDSWVILSDIEQSIKRKIESAGTPLKDWDINIYRGVLTGFNDAFVITTERRDEILAACKTDKERMMTASIIRPILRGRDIKRYSHEWANLWLVWIPWHFPLHLDPSIQGASQEAEKEFTKQYPAVYNHLLQYKTELSARNKAETGIRYEWYAMQRWGANYWEDFDKPKIIFQEIVQESQFMLDLDTHYMCNDTCRIIVGRNLEFLLRILNSELFFYSVKTFYGGGGLGDHGVRMKHTFFCNFPCIPYVKELEEKSGQAEIESFIYGQYGLSTEEIEYIKGSL